MLILLPPSEGKAAPRRGRPLDLDTLSSPSLTAARAAVIDALTALGDGPDAARALGLTPGQAAELTRNVALRTAPTARADAVYTGVLFDAWDVATLSAAAKRRAATRVGITSSVFGIVRPGDRIAPYRLSGDASLPGLGSVAGHWRAHLDEAMAEATGTGLVVDLRSSTYAAFWRAPAAQARRLATVRVLHEVDGVRKVVSHFNKATKGRIVRAVLEDGGNPRTPAAFADQLRDLGWKVEEESGPTGTRLDVVVDAV